MLPRLFITIRDWMLTLRAWLWEWLDLLTVPVRAVRAFRPGRVASDAMAGGRDAVGLGVAGVQGTVGTVVGFFRFLLQLPLLILRFGIWAGPFVWWWLRTRTWMQLAVTGGSVAIVLAGLVGPCLFLYQEHRREAWRAQLWQKYEIYLQTGDPERLEATLKALQLSSPSDTVTASRLDDLRARTAPAGDTQFMRFLMRLHGNEGHWDRAAREATRLIEIAPNDWEGRYCLLEDAARRGDEDAVQTHLAALPRTKESGESLPAPIAYHLALLFQRLGETKRYDEIIDHIVAKVLPILRRDDVAQLGPDACVLLVRCYHQALNNIERHSNLTRYWVPVQRACRAAADSPETTTRGLVALGQTQELQPLALAEFARRRLITQDEYRALSADVEDNLRTIWGRVLEREPRSVPGHIGLARHQARTGDVSAGVQTLARGLDICGADADLIATMAGLLRDVDSRAGLTFLQQASDGAKRTPRMCQLCADMAQRAGRPDVALEACRQALDQDPTLAWAHFVKGEILLNLGKPAEAIAALGPIQGRLAGDPAGCALYIRVLCACGSYQDAEAYLAQVKAEDRPIPVLLEAARALQSAGRSDDAVRWAKNVLDTDPLNLSAFWVIGDCLTTLADKGDRIWDTDRALEALRAYRAVQRQQPKDLRVVNNIAWLELKALGRSQDAFESAAPLRALENEAGMPAEFLETLGACYLGVGRYDDARRLLAQAVATAGPKPGFYIHLALAYHGLKNQQLAEHYMEAAARMAKTQREQADLQDAARAIRGK